ncbi:MAG TPA: alpha/beta fold hydrolase [Lacipirellulaceae bacterium]|nr:alpha/beta fold hydrolase [Lacipirellulaceae bacterium]
MVRAEGLLALPTLGGVWMWSDEVIYHDWRIQKHAVTGHYRLIDARARRRQAGDFESCLAALERAKVAEAIPPLPQDVVVVLHGLGANRAVMARLCKALREEGKFHVVNVTYPSTMLSIDDYARSLESVIRHLAGVERVSFVAHSMGNIVVRKYLRNMETLDPALRPAVEYGRMVMIAPPNHGAEMADHLTDSALERELAELLVGEPARQLAPSQGWPALERQLATPGFPFGIIAGGKGDAEGFLDAIPGDDDGLLSVESARLAGAADFVQVVSGIHQFMPQYDATRAATLSFLGRGYFTTQGEAQPIAAVR